MREEEVEEESPARSILGLGRIEPSPLRLDASALRSNGGPPPNTSLLGLQDLNLPPLRMRPPPAAAEGDPPTESLLGLQGLRAAPLARVPLAPGIDTEPPNGSLLGLGNYRPTTPLFRPPPPRRPAAVEAESRSFFGLPVRAAAPRAETVSRSFFGLSAPPPGTSLTPEEVAQIVPEFEKDVEHRAQPAFPVERAVLASVFAHVLLLILLLRMPAARSDPSKGLLAAFVPPPKSEEEKYPIVFREAPGPARENPKKSADLSDADRRAGGGDRSKPRSNTPFIPDRNGIRGLRPGPPVARAAPARPASPPAEAARPRPEAQATAQAPQTTLDKDPSGFQVPRNGATREGSTAAQQPRALADIASVAKDAAREVVSQAGGGENGAGFPNPDGGLVDTGPVSFETKWYDWGEYMEAMLRRIKLHHDILRDPFKGWVTYRWAILPDGRVADLQRIDTSGNPAYDAMARRAIEGSNPFKALPKDLLLTLGPQHREHVTVTFIYNYTTAEFESLVRNRR